MQPLRDGVGVPVSAVPRASASPYSEGEPSLPPRRVHVELRAGRALVARPGHVPERRPRLRVGAGVGVGGAFRYVRGVAVGRATRVALGVGAFRGLRLGTRELEAPGVRQGAREA